MAPVGVARELPPLSRIFDCLAPVPPTSIPSLAQRFDAAARYVETLTVGERDSLWAAGLPILLLSTAPVGPLTPELGASKAAYLAKRADDLGAPGELHQMVDLEAAHGAPSQVAEYDDALTEGIEARGRFALAYVGAEQPLSGGELYLLPHVHLYWRGGSNGIPEPDCGFALWQIPPLDVTIGGHVVDGSCSGRDTRGRAPILWWPE